MKAGGGGAWGRASNQEGRGELVNKLRASWCHGAGVGELAVGVGSGAVRAEVS